MSDFRSEDLSFAYANRVVLDRVTMEFRAGEVVVLLGANGAGKTTLLQLLCRQLRPASGVVTLSERDIVSFSRRALAKSMAFMPQSENREAELTVHEVVSLGRAPHSGWWMPWSTHDLQAVDRSLAATGLVEHRDRLITQLSGGEWRRMILARALAQEAPILLLDEPTAGLDLKYQFDVLGRVQRMAKERNLVVVVTLHDLNHAAIFGDRLALLADHKLLAIGTPREVLTPNNIEQAFDIAVTVIDHPLHGTPFVIPAYRTSQDGDVDDNSDNSGVEGVVANG
jgi:iron complex transport system ATP-binding protein